jgi:hypothetical protein
MTWRTVASAILEYAQLAWMIAGMVLLLNKPFHPGETVLTTVARTIWAEGRPFYLPAVVADAVLDAVEATTLLGQASAIVGLVVGMFCWYVFKDIDDDDRWRRRKRKVANRVAQVGARLQVAPAGAGA